MKKKTELVFVPVANFVPAGEIDGLLERYREEFISRKMEAEYQMHPPCVVATFEEIFPQGENGLSSSLLNVYSNAGAPDMRIAKITVTYEDALIPFQYKWEMKASRSTFRRKEIRTDPFVQEQIYISPIIKCFRDKKIVIISLELDGRHEEDLYRLAILNAEHKIERIVWQVQCARQLIQAFRTKPANKGFIDRSVTELYAAIGRF